jgi:hypothetical protein
MKRILLLFLCFIIINNQKDFPCPNLKNDSLFPNLTFDATQTISNFSIDMISYYSWFGSYGYCQDYLVSAGVCCPKLLNNQWEIIDHQEIQDEHIIDHYFEFNYILFRSDINKKYILTFPGTRDKTQLIFEITESNLVSYNNNNNNNNEEEKNIKIHSYFLEMYKKIEKNIFNSTTLKDISLHSDYQFIFIGHSLGGAIASIAAFNSIHEKYINNKNNPVLITFGQPRTGNYYFSEKVMEYVPNIFRVVRNGDIVSLIPPRIIKDKLNGYSHFGGLYVLNEEMTNFRQCKYEQFEDFDDFGCVVNVTIHVLNHIYYFNPDLKYGKRCKENITTRFEFDLES